MVLGARSDTPKYRRRETTVPNPIHKDQSKAPKIVQGTQNTFRPFPNPSHTSPRRPPPSHRLTTVFSSPNKPPPNPNPWPWPWLGAAAPYPLPWLSFLFTDRRPLNLSLCESKKDRREDFPILGLECCWKLPREEPEPDDAEGVNRPLEPTLETPVRECEWGCKAAGVGAPLEILSSFTRARAER